MKNLMLIAEKCIRLKWIVAILLFVAFFSGYLYSSGLLRVTGVFKEFDIFFEMDTPRVVQDITVLHEDHSRTRVHPLFVLMTNPVGTQLAKLAGDEEQAAIIINSALGALGVSLAFGFFMRYGHRLIDAVLLAALFGVTTSQFFISSIPDTISLGVVSLVLLYSLFFVSVKEKRVRFLPWFLVGVFTLGVTTTNFVQAGILFFIATLDTLDIKKWGRTILQSMKYGLAVLAATAALALVQKAFYPTAALFFLPQSFSGELTYASTLVLQQPCVVLSYLVHTFLLINIAAPAPRFFTIPGLEHPGVTFAASNDYSLLGWIALSLWVGLMIFSVGRILLQKKHLLFFVGLGICLAFNFLLHSFYGVMPNRIELFLYTGNLTFLLITPLAEAYLPKWENVFRSVLVVLIVLLAINNFQVMQVIVQAMAGS